MIKEYFAIVATVSNGSGKINDWFVSEHDHYPRPEELEYEIKTFANSIGSPFKTIHYKVEKRYTFDK